VKLVAIDIEGDRILNQQVDRAGVVGQRDLLAHLKTGVCESRSRQALG